LILVLTLSVIGRHHRRSPDSPLWYERSAGLLFEHSVRPASALPSMTASRSFESLRAYMLLPPLLEFGAHPGGGVEVFSSLFPDRTVSAALWGILKAPLPSDLRHHSSLRYYAVSRSPQRWITRWAHLYRIAVNPSLHQQQPSVAVLSSTIFGLRQLSILHLIHYSASPTVQRLPFYSLRPALLSVLKW
jgi:hypothetical protein